MKTVLWCITALICAALIAYAIALPRYQISERGDGFLINDRFSSEIFYCTIPRETRVYGCLRLNPASSTIIDASKP